MSYSILNSALSLTVAMLLMTGSSALAQTHGASLDGPESACTFDIALDGQQFTRGIMIADSFEDPLSAFDAFREFEKVFRGAGDIDFAALPNCNGELLAKGSSVVASHGWVSVRDLSRAVGDERAFRLDGKRLSTVDVTSAEHARENRLPLIIRKKGVVSDKVVRLSNGREEVTLLPLADLMRALGGDDVAIGSGGGGGAGKVSMDWIENMNWLDLRSGTREGILLSYKACCEG